MNNSRLIAGTNSLQEIHPHYKPTISNAMVTHLIVTYGLEEKVHAGETAHYASVERIECGKEHNGKSAEQRQRGEDK